MADINVLMTVDTEAITPNNLSTSVVLTDDNNDSDRIAGDSETFTIIADAGDTVGFSIAAKDNRTPVSLESFEYEGGDTGVFNPLPASNNNFIGTISGNKGEAELFYINFKVGGVSYKMDPEIDVEPPG